MTARRLGCPWVLVSFLSAFGPVVTAAAGTKPLTFEDLMRFRTIHDPVISEDGEWLA